MWRCAVPIPLACDSRARRVLVLLESSDSTARVIETTLLRGEERWKIQDSRRFRVLNVMSGRGFQLHPAVPIELGRSNDVAQQTAPFHERPLDIAVTKRVVRELVTRCGSRDQLAHDFGRARAVVDRHSHLEIAGMVRSFVNTLRQDA